MTSYLLAIDNGSQSTKVSIVDVHGRVHASAQQRLRPYQYPAPGRVVHPDDDLWDSIAATCRQAMQRFAGDPHDIVAAGLCTIRFCRAYLNEHGVLAEPVLSWMDERVSRPHEAGSEAVRWITTSSGYITHRLTGRAIDTAANYQGVWPIDVATAQWSDDPTAYQETGMPREQLFVLIQPGDLLGHVTASAALACGLPEGLPVHATANDKAVEALGCGVRGSGKLLVSLGTYIAGMTAGQRPVTDPSGDLWTNFASVPGEYLYESNGIRRGMWTVSWFEEMVNGDVADLNSGAADVPPGSDGILTLLDWLAPVSHPHRRGMLIGFDGSQGRYHVFRSLLESIAITMDRHCSAMEQRLGRRSETVVVSGGGARSDLMMQIFADVFERPAERAEVRDAAGMGAAICAAVGAGIHPDWDAAIKAMVRQGDVFAPEPASVDVYTSVKKSYGLLAANSDDLLQMLYPSS